MGNSDGSINRREAGLIFLQLAAFLATSREVVAAPLPAGDRAVRVLHKVMVPMRDGVQLATEIYLPETTASSEKLPVLLERTPYNRIAPRNVERGRFFASHGYAVVYQDVRGRGDSQGAYVKYLSDGNDGFDCCSWIMKQPWGNGKIGTMGLSYDAHTQGALASEHAPGVTAMFIDCGAFANAYQDGIRQGGTFELKQVTWAFNRMTDAPDVAKDPALLAKIKAVDLKDWFGRMPWSRGHSPLSLVPEYENYVFDQWEHGNFDSYWKQVGIYGEGYFDKWNDAAMVMISSWYDAYTRSTTNDYLGLSAKKKGPIQLVLGPWTHGANTRTFSGNVDFGPQSLLAGNIAPSYEAMELRWFEKFLKGIDNGADRDPKVRIFVMGGGSGRKNSAGRMDHGGSWKNESDWPPPNTQHTAYYFHTDGLMSLDKPAENGRSRNYKYDPRNPVPSIGGTITSGEPIMVGGGFDQKEAPEFYGSKEPYLRLSSRPDVLVFQTPVLTKDVEITGAIEANLWISSDSKDTDFTAKLVDVYPPNEDYPEGYELNVADGIMRCRYRDSWEQPSFMEPGKAYSIKVLTFPTSNLFKAGHRIRLDISSSNFPHFDLNFNTGEPEGKATSVKVANNTVYLDAKRASHVILPIIPPRGT